MVFCLFFSSIMMFSNYVMHIDSSEGVIHAFNITHPFAGYASQADEIWSVRLSVMLMASGMIVGQIIWTMFIQLPYAKKMFPDNTGLIYFLSVITTSVLVAAEWGWYFSASNVTVNALDRLPATYAIAFFLGLSNGVIFVDTLTTLAFYLNNEQVVGTTADVILMCLVSVMTFVIAPVRFSSGIFGSLAPNGQPVVDFKYFTLVLAIISSVVFLLTVFASIAFSCLCVVVKKVRKVRNK